MLHSTTVNLPVEESVLCTVHRDALWRKDGGSDSLEHQSDLQTSPTVVIPDRLNEIKSGVCILTHKLEHKLMK